MRRRPGWGKDDVVILCLEQRHDTEAVASTPGLVVYKTTRIGDLSQHGGYSTSGRCRY